MSKASFHVPTQSDLEDIGIEFFTGCALACATKSNMAQIGIGLALRKLISCVAEKQLKEIHAQVQKITGLHVENEGFTYTLTTAASSALLKGARLNGIK